MNSQNDTRVLLSHGIVLPVSTFTHKTFNAVLTPANIVVTTQQQQQDEIVQASTASTAIARGDRQSAGDGGVSVSERTGINEIRNGNPIVPDNVSFLCTPKKDALSDTIVVLQLKRQQFNAPGVGVIVGAAATSNELQMQHSDYYSLNVTTSTNLLKNRYVICTLPNPTLLPPTIVVPTSTPPPLYFNNNNSNNKINQKPNYSAASSSYQQNIIPSLSNLRCIDIYTGETFLCKIINEPLHKVQQAYFKLQQSENTGCESQLFGHQLIRPAKEMIPLNSKRTYIILSMNNRNNNYNYNMNQEYEINEHQSQINQNNSNSNSIRNSLIQGAFEDLHTYIRDKRYLDEIEARSLFYQICETVLVCHRNGVILRDLKLKRFYFVDEARTMLQYESLEGSMILDNPNDDVLSDKIGCPLYTAPELLCHDPTYRGKPADIWSLGVILYTMLVGQYPFYERGGYNLLALIRHHNIQIPAHLSRSARRLISDLLHKNHMERITIDYIFLSPWLRDQGQFLMYVPVNGIICDDDDDETGDNNVNEMDDENINVDISDINTYNDDTLETITSHSDDEMSWSNNPLY